MSSRRGSYSPRHYGLRPVTELDRECYEARAKGEHFTTIAKRIGKSPEWVGHAVERVTLERACKSAER